MFDVNVLRGAADGFAVYILEAKVNVGGGFKKRGNDKRVKVFESEQAYKIGISVEIPREIEKLMV